MIEEFVDHVIWNEENIANYELSVVARLKGPGVSNIQYMVRLKEPKKDPVNYMLTLEGFKELGKLLIALHDFCKGPLCTNETNVETLKALLTKDNIKNYARALLCFVPPSLHG
jgi:hypothetical protein